MSANSPLSKDLARRRVKAATAYCVNVAEPSHAPFSVPALLGYRGSFRATNSRTIDTGHVTSRDRVNTRPQAGDEGQGATVCRTLGLDQRRDSRPRLSRPRRGWPKTGSTTTECCRCLGKWSSHTRESARAYEEAGGWTSGGIGTFREIGVIEGIPARQLVRVPRPRPAIDAAIAEDPGRSIRGLGRLWGRSRALLYRAEDFGAVGPMDQGQVGLRLPASVRPGRPPETR